MRPKKSYGQNFLINDGVCQKIVQQLQSNHQCDKILEVGPGKGALTQYLLPASQWQYKAVEADRDMVQYLQSNYELTDEQIIQKDFLKLALDQVYEKAEFDLIGNFPYNISTQIVFRMLKYKDLIPTMVGMFQKEVAERIVSSHGTKSYGILSVLTQVSYEVKLLFTVSPGSFYPAPKVTSAVILLQRKADFMPPCDESLLKAVVKASFHHRRKMLRNSLKTFIQDKAFQHEFLSRRPEQMSVEDYIELTQSLEKHK